MGFFQFLHRPNKLIIASGRKSSNPIFQLPCIINLLPIYYHLGIVVSRANAKGSPRVSKPEIDIANLRSSSILVEGSISTGQSKPLNYTGTFRGLHTTISKNGFLCGELARDFSTILAVIRFRIPLAISR
jgi:hypothetical protein